MHPAASFLYALALLGITAFSRNPLIAAESLVSAAALALISGRLRGIGWTCAVAAAAVLANFLFVHNGATALFFVGDLAFTLEALCCGIVTGVMLAAVCAWGSNAVRFVPSDKYIWLFGKIAPSAGLVLSCALRFVPLFIRRTREFIAVQRRTTVSGYLAAFTASIGYSAEQAMDSALSMRSRGYGTAKRTSYSVYRFTKSTAAALGVTAALGGVCAALMICGAGDFTFYPALSRIPARPLDTVLYCAFGVLCILPAAIAAFDELHYR